MSAERRWGMNPGRMTAIVTKASFADVVAAFEKACGGATWKISRRPWDDLDNRRLTSLVARSSLHFQSLELEVIEMTDRNLLILLIHPQLLHAFKIPALPFVRVPVMAEPVTKRIKRFVKSVTKADKTAQVRHRTHWRGYLVGGSLPTEQEISELVSQLVPNYPQAEQG